MRTCKAKTLRGIDTQSRGSVSTLQRLMTLTPKSQVAVRDHSDPRRSTKTLKTDFIRPAKTSKTKERIPTANSKPKTDSKQKSVIRKSTAKKDSVKKQADEIALYSFDCRGQLQDSTPELHPETSDIFGGSVPNSRRRFILEKAQAINDNITSCYTQEQNSETMDAITRIKLRY